MLKAFSLGTCLGTTLHCRPAKSICYVRRLFRKVYSAVPQQVPKEKAFNICRMVKRFNVHTKNLLGQ